MSRFLSYDPEQAYLLPPSVKDELGADHLWFFVRAVVKQMDLSAFEQGRVAIDATRIQANASRDRVDSESQLRQERAKLRRQVRRDMIAQRFSPG